VPRATAAGRPRARLRLEDRPRRGVHGRAAFAAGAVEHRSCSASRRADSRIEERRDGSDQSQQRSVTNVILGESFPLRDFPITDVTRIGAFVQDEMPVRRVRVDAHSALRVDYYESTRGPTPCTARTSDDRAVADDTAVAPSSAVTRDLGNGLTAFAQLRRAVSVPPPET